MSEENNFILILIITEFIQVILLSWIKYRQSECSIGSCKGSCTKIKENESENEDEDEYESENENDENETDFSNFNYKSIKQ